MSDESAGRKPGNDPLDPLRRLVDDWERRIDGVANQVMGTDGFSQAMNRGQSLGLRLQQGFRDAMAAHLKQMNMPSREDVLRLGETVQGLDQRIARIEQLLDDLLRQTRPPPTIDGPPRTRKPPSQRQESSPGAAKGELP